MRDILLKDIAELLDRAFYSMPFADEVEIKYSAMVRIEEILAILDAVIQEYEAWQIDWPLLLRDEPQALFDYEPLVSETTFRAKEAMRELRQLCDQGLLAGLRETCIGSM